jgi:hypothetical protein
VSEIKKDMQAIARGPRGLRHGGNPKTMWLSIIGLSILAPLVQAEVYADPFPITEKAQVIVVADFFGDLKQQLNNKARELVNGSVPPDQSPANQAPTEQPVPTSEYPEQAKPTNTKAKKATKANSVESTSSLTLDDWLGRWRSQDGENSLVISSAKLVSTFRRKDDDGKSSNFTVTAHWRNLTNSNEEETFGLSKKQVTLDEIAKRYEKALQQYKKDPMDYGVSDPKITRKAMLTMSPGSYQVMWSYFGGESGSEYIVDKDHMLEVKDDPYGFSVTLYNRVK